MKKLTRQLKAERNRLGLTQMQAASICETCKRTYVSWEHGTAKMPFEAVLKLSARGFDFSALLTKQASEAVSPKETNCLTELLAAQNAVTRDIESIIERSADSDLSMAIGGQVVKILDEGPNKGIDFTPIIMAARMAVALAWHNTLKKRGA
jgi:transcriptional regulator with XRE-family HTH domain